MVSSHPNHSSWVSVVCLFCRCRWVWLSCGILIAFLIRWPIITPFPISVLNGLRSSNVNLPFFRLGSHSKVLVLSIRRVCSGNKNVSSNLLYRLQLLSE